MVRSSRLGELLSGGKVYRLGAEFGPGSLPGAAVCPTGVAAIDRVLPGGGLALGAVHEWFGYVECPAMEGWPGRGQGWIAPVSILTHLARLASARAARRGGEGEGPAVVFVGRRCWPTPWAMVAGAHEGLPAIVGRSLLVDAGGTDERVWSIDVALRSGAVGVVVADGSGMDLSATRRLQLAAEGARGGLVLLARPPWEVDRLSSSWSRWLVGPAVTGWSRPRWRLTLARCRGVGTAPSWLVEMSRPWSSEHGREEGVLDLAAEVGGGRGASACVEAGEVA